MPRRFYIKGLTGRISDNFTELSHNFVQKHATFKVGNTFGMELHMQWTEKYNALNGRESFTPFAERFAETAGGMEDAHTEYLSKLNQFKNASPKIGEALSDADKAANEVLGKAQSAIKELEVATDALKSKAELGVKGWVAKDAKQAAEVKRLEAAYSRANATFEKALGSFKEGEHQDLTKFRDAFENLRTQVKSGEGVMNGMFGTARINGWAGMVDTARHNLEGMNLWKNNEAITLKRAAPVAFRGGALVVAGAAIGDSLLRSRDRDGEERGMVKRGMELAAGVGIGTGALLFGRAL